MGSLLGDLDANLKNGDRIIDPFNLLKTYKIEISDNFISIINLLDINKIRNETKQMLYDDWMFLLSDAKYLLCPFEIREIIIRLSWWVCYNLIVKNKITTGSYAPKINLMKFIKQNESINLDNLEVMLYITPSRKSILNVSYDGQLHDITLMLPTCDSIQITVKNIHLVK